VVTEVTVKLLPKPPGRKWCWPLSTGGQCATVANIIAAGCIPAGLR
jgi:hypothetical protein